ncbi:ABC transporter permease [Pseudarthrobacter sp. NS4]|uniref:ABC transporter permease n=1 Tax=Pseudarthrobacter sp. NS4 TaxID=2973976 RepID=UPI002161DB65|nr:ABC transporter permease subunit [Pseudarthrobacter sp. NS4]
MWIRVPGVLLAMPAVLVVSFVVLGGSATVAVQSLGLMPLVGRRELSTAAYTVNAGDLLHGAAISLALAGTSTLLACLIGLTVALVIMQGRWCGKLVAAMGTLSIPVPHIVGAASVGLLIGDSGLLARISGAADNWPELVGGPWWAAVVFEYAWKESAFVGLVVAATLATRSVSYEETAALLGAGRVRRLRHVLLPLSLPSLIISGTIAFIYSFGSYEVAWLLGRPYPEPLPVMALRLYNSVTLTSRPEAAAVAAVTAAVSLCAAALALLFLRKVPLWR